MTRPIIVCGLGQAGTQVVHLLHGLGEKVTVITAASREDRMCTARELGANVVIGDARDVRLLEKAGLATAAAVLVVTDSDITNVEIALDAKRAHPDVPVVARIFDRHLANSLERSCDIRCAASTSALAAPAIAAAAMDSQIIGSFSLGAQSFILGRAEQSVFTAEKENCVLITGPGRASPKGEPAAVLAEQAAWRKTARFACEPTTGASTPLQSGRWTSPWRAMWTEAPVSLRHAFLVLLGLIVVSVAIFKLTMGLSVVDAIYYTVTTVTTVGYGDITPRDSDDLLKLYASIVMLLGSAMMAILFSFVADFVVKERFRALIQRRPIPKGGHVVVVGLGNVGYRTVNALERWSVPVVAVDLASEGRFTPEVETRCPIVIGDGRLSGILLKARIETAGAVIAVTGDDAVNLGVALAAKQMNPKARTVARVFEAEFASKVQSGLGIDATLSASQIAAPTLVAAAFYPGVHLGFVLDGWLYALCEHRAEPAWVGRDPYELMKEGAEIVLTKQPPQERFYPPRKNTPIAASDELLVVYCRSMVGGFDRSQQ